MDTKERLLEFLRQHHVMTVAVIDTEGKPHAAALWYAVTDDLCFYVVSDTATVHGRAMLERGELAGTIQRDRQKREEICGAQFRGRCERLDRLEKMQGLAALGMRFPFFDSNVKEIAEALVKTSVWRIEPSWMRLIDNSRGFGFKEEWRR